MQGEVLILSKFVNKLSEFVNNNITIELLINTFLPYTFTECYLLHFYVHYILDDWRVDGYRWFQYGTKLIPRSRPVLQKIHFVTVLPHGHDKRFKRQAFHLLDAKQSQKAVLLHYLGDESIVIDYSHGNAKSNQIYCTAPSVLAEHASTHDHPSIIYKNAISSSGCPAEYQPAFMPHNCRQIKNLQARVRQKARLTHDALYNLHELAYDLDGFVKTVTTYPDLAVICGHDRVISELDSVLHLISDRPQLLSYDTTFQLGDFYLSALLFRHTLFTNSPVIPALFLIHERKFEKIHAKFMECLAELVPGLVNGKCPVPLVTDEEVGINKVSNASYMYKHQ